MEAREDLHRNRARKSRQGDGRIDGHIAEARDGEGRERKIWEVYLHCRYVIPRHRGMVGVWDTLNFLYTSAMCITCIG
jgi:hypothetical protein